ncbi:hypothetical protein [Thermus thermamylovorans]|uniref:Uncharacterized protein n=1 Tax=Thermus thermamylovorans TaxID=2509362 RepID=A0A4Q9B948_9DEIN|nr:hypothetical protein [Thermus thermamylovorans]TBH21448.1 hypothetical protein ETP66_02235 [Thermus thermamylovorans]
MLVYLDQNYASRMAKHLLGQGGHEAFGRLYRALKGRALAPPSPFHVLETLHPVRGPEERVGYLLPALQEVFAALSGGLWVRPWQEVAWRQARGLFREDLLWTGGSWEVPADLSPFLGLPEALRGLPYREALEAALKEVKGRTGLGEVPFVRLLARLLALMATDPHRKPRPSDLLDAVMAATLYPYADLLLTDRYLRNLLPERSVGGRQKEVEALVDRLSHGVDSSP